MASIKNCLTPVSVLSRRWLHSNLPLFCSRRLLEQVPEYKSIYSLDKVYPKSKLNHLAPTEPPQTSDKKFNGYIPMDKINVSSCRSSGPGGQHANSTDTKITIAFKLAEADWIPAPIREQLEKLHKSTINKKGEWIIRSEKTRVASLNLADCLDKLRAYITEAQEKIPAPPDPVTLEMRREKYEKAAQRRLAQKRHKSALLKMKNSVQRLD